MSSVVYYNKDGNIIRSSPDLSNREFYRDHILVRAFLDAWGGIPAVYNGLIRPEGVEIHSSARSDLGAAYNGWTGFTDFINGAWAPDPEGALPAYVGAAFLHSVCVTGFQFAAGVEHPSDCSGGVGPCGYPDEFTFEASHDGVSWNPLFSVENYTGMQVGADDPICGKLPTILKERVFLSEVFPVSGGGRHRAYRMNITGAAFDLWGGYTVTELIFYGRT